MGAWIETTQADNNSRNAECRPSHGVVDRNCSVHAYCDHPTDCRPSHGGVDRTAIRSLRRDAWRRRPSHGGVDGTFVEVGLFAGDLVPPRMGAWIEPILSAATPCDGMSPLAWGRGSKLA